VILRTEVVLEHLVAELRRGGWIQCQDQERPPSAAARHLPPQAGEAVAAWRTAHSPRAGEEEAASMTVPSPACGGRCPRRGG
jgi:hypothetical protein